MRLRFPDRTLGTLGLVSLVGVTLVVASLVSRSFFEGRTREPPARPPAIESSGAGMFRVSALEGAVEALHDGQWYVVQAGDLLSLQDVIRTPRGSRALLRRGSVEIEVRENVDIRLDSLAAETATFGVLRGGNVVANVGAQAEKLEITARETRAVNRGPARWVVSLGPSGQVSVAASRGDVLFAAHGKEVAVPAGSESTALPGRQPGDPEPIPEELLLSVIWPELEKSEGQAEVAGKVSPSSRVKINGSDAEVGPDGRFVSSIPVAVGKNEIQIEAEDINGRKRSVTKVLRRRPRAPTLEAADEEIWKQ